MWQRLFIATMLAHASFGVWAASGTADAYPNKPIRIIDGFPAGGSTDYLARSIGAKLTERFGQPVIVDNRPGHTSNVGAATMARANPDGYTLFSGLSTVLSSSRSLYSNLGYDVLKDFSYVSQMAIGTNVLVVHPSIPVNSVAELVTLARSKPKSMRYATPGVASPGHLAMEVLLSRARMDLLHVPYKGSPPAIVATAGGEVEIGFVGVSPASVPMIQAKRLKALAVTGAKRSGVLPEVPTVAESGFAGFNVTDTYGIFAPAGTPAAVVRLLNAEIRNIVQMNDIREKFATQGLEAAGSTPGEFKALIEAEVTQWARVIKDANITAN